MGYCMYVVGRMRAEYIVDSCGFLNVMCKILWRKGPLNTVTYGADILTSTDNLSDFG